MDNNCSELSIGFNSEQGLLYKNYAGDIGVFDKVNKLLNSGQLISVRALSNNKAWSMDVMCEKTSAYIVVLHIATGETYTYLNPHYIKMFEQIETNQSSIYICKDMSELINEDDTQEALISVDICGNECPQLHVCKDMELLKKIIFHFLQNGNALNTTTWLKS